MFSLTNEPKTHFVIDRKTWLRGEGGMTSRLLRPSDGRMCCLGQVALQCGLNTNDIFNKGAVSTIFASPEKLPDSLKIFVESIDTNGSSRSSEFAYALMKTNDSRNIDEYDREERLKELAEKEGITLEFIN